MALTPPKRTQTERRAEAEQSLFEAGVHLASERGFDGFSLAELGHKAGYSRGLPAHYFGSKENFQKNLIYFIITEFKNRQVAPQPNKGISAIANTIEQAFEAPNKDTIYARILLILLSDKSGKFQSFAELADFRKRTISGIERDIQQGVQDGYIRKTVNPNLISLILIETICNVIQLTLNDDSIDAKAAGHELTQLILLGIATP